MTIKAAKELTIKAAKARAAKAKGEAKDEANQAETKAKKSAALQQASAKQKIKKRAATEKAAAAPTKEDAAVKHSCTVSLFPGARVVIVIAALFFAAAMALPVANSSISAAGAAEVVNTKSIFSWANDQQCGLYDNDDSCAVQVAFETTCSADAMPDDAAKGFGRSASLDTAGAEGAKPCATAASHRTHCSTPQRLLY